MDGDGPFAFLKGLLHLGSLLASVIFPCVRRFVPCEIIHVEASNTGLDIQEVPTNVCWFQISIFFDQTLTYIRIT